MSFYIEIKRKGDVPRSFETYGFGREGSASHSRTMRFHSRIVSRGKVAVKSSAAFRCKNAISFALVRFVLSSEPIQDTSGKIRSWKTGTKPTESEEFLPIPTPPTVVERGVSCTWSHLSRGEGCKIYVGPFLLHGLSVRSANTTSIIERVSGLAFFAVSGQVEFWN